MKENLNQKQRYEFYRDELCGTDFLTEKIAHSPIALLEEYFKFGYVL